jgi:hypothetical protein
MSRLHFRLQTDNQGCTVEDLRSRNGTLVNGEPVSEPVVLREGDQVQAGQTRFRVGLEGEARQQVSTIPIDPDVADAGQRAADEAARSLQQELTLTYTAEVCESSGLTLFRGAEFGEAGQPTSPSVVAGLLSQQVPLYLIVHFAKAQLEVLPPLTEAVPLFDWLPGEAARMSPLIVPPGTCPQQDELIDAAWDNDSLIGFFASSPSESVVSHLRSAIRFNAEGLPWADGEAEGILGYCWPCVLAQLLAFRTAQFVGRLLAGIDAALMEVPDLPNTWQVFARSNFSETFAKVGFREQSQL